MDAVNVLTCFLIAGGGSMLGAGLMYLIRTDQPRVREALRVYKIAFWLLTLLAVGALVPPEWRLAGVKLSIGCAVVGVAALGWGFRLLNGRRTSPQFGASVLLLLALVMAAVATFDDRGYAQAMATVFAIVSVAILVDQSLIILAGVKVRPAEYALLIVIALFTLNWIFTAWHGYTSSDPVPPDFVHAPPWLRPVSAVSYATLPLAVAAVVFALINDRLMQQLRNHALSDDLTGALSRRGLREMGEQMLAMQSSRPNLVAVLMLDVDHFKSINDRYGHLCGDDVLRHMTQLVKEHLRAEALVARYGGEEFTVLLPLHEGEAALVVAERLRAVIEASPCETKLGPIAITVSIGVAYHGAGATLEQTLQRADERLYIAKNTGRNRVVAAPADTDQAAAMELDQPVAWT